MSEKKQKLLVPEQGSCGLNIGPIPGGRKESKTSQITRDLEEEESCTLLPGRSQDFPV